MEKKKKEADRQRDRPQADGHTDQHTETPASLTQIASLFPASRLAPPHTREASDAGDLPRQLGHRVAGAAARGQRAGRADPRGDAHLHLPAARPQRLQRGLPGLHREGPHRAVHHDGSGAGRYAAHGGRNEWMAAILALALRAKMAAR